MLRVFFILLGVFLSASNLYAQTDTSSIYYKGLKLHLANTEEMYKKEPNTKQPPFTVYVQKLFTVTDDLPNQIGNCKIIYLDKEGIKKKASSGKSLYLIRINPITIMDETVILSIVNFNVSYRKNHFYYGNGGGSKIVLKQNCSNGKFEIIEVKQGGI